MGRDEKFMRSSYLNAKRSLNLKAKLFGHRTDCAKTKAETYIDSDIFDALIAYIDAKNLKAAKGPIINYAMKKFFKEEGFYPPKPE